MWEESKIGEDQRTFVEQIRLIMLNEPRIRHSDQRLL